MAVRSVVVGLDVLQSPPGGVHHHWHGHHQYLSVGILGCEQPHDSYHRACWVQWDICVKKVERVIICRESECMHFLCKQEGFPGSWV